MHENFDYYLKNYSHSLPETGLSDERKARIASIYPPSLAEFIIKHGFVSFHNGLFRLCDPDEFRPILSLVLKNDKDFNPDECHVVGYTAFGMLECWSPKLYKFHIELPFGHIYCTALTWKDWNPVASADHIASGIVPDFEDADFLDCTGEPMFNRCVKTYGQPGPAECFGFLPALALVGAFTPLQGVENIKRMSALEHFTILAQLEQFRLVRAGPEDIFTLRPIGYYS